MAAAKRISDEPAYVLHSYDWSESSLILEVFCRRQGRVALVAKGAKKPSSNFRPVLLPLQPLLLTYTLAGDGAGDIHTLKGAEWVGGHVMPTGDALLSGLYLNELLLRLLARADAHAGLFDVYAGVVRVLASEHGDALEPVLRSFELLLLRDLGLLPTLDAETATLANLRPEGRYTLVAEGGLRTASQPIAPAWRAASGVRCKRRWTKPPATPPRCVPAPPWRPNSNPSCGRCCNTIAAARCCAPASS